MKKYLLIVLFVIVSFPVISGEGMWLPIFLKQLNEADMQSKGMKVSADAIYSVNNSSMKDAVVLFGGGCTGEIISEQGLLLTNHHCGFSQIQSHSSLEKDYIKNGFWAYSAEEELACPGLTVTFIIRIEDVTQKMLSQLPAGIVEPERDLKIKELAATMEKAAVEGTHYTASIRPFYNGNQFYMFVMETFKDVRMVGAPPSSIGKFGGDTDNWMWPRHTGDFALFRVYAGADNKPAEYSKENKPFKPRHSFPVSLKGVQPGDFTMVYGFPGRTTQYIPSAAVSATLEVANPARIKIRTERLRIIDAAMRSGDKLRIQYAAKQATIANAWKKWQGESKGLKRMKTIEVKKSEEAAFQKWAADAGKTEYANLISDYENTYAQFRPLLKTNDYINEAAFGVELIRYARAYNKLAMLCETNPVDEKAVKDEAERILSGAKGFFRDFDEATDKQLFVSMMQMYMKDVDASMHPAYLQAQLAKNKNNWTAFADDVYAKSMLSDSIKVRTLLSGFTSSKSKKLLKDPAFLLAKSFASIYLDKIEADFVKLNTKINTLNRIYMAAQMEMKPSHMFYPDANSTLRVAYGNVSGYEPADGVTYDHITTIEGIMEKEDASIEEFEVPQRLKDLYKTKDYGAYGVNGTLPVAFVASNHTTGGNSGSPVLNAHGELIGTNFDRVWEGTMSDIDFDPDRCRNISLDIRYTLFVIDKYAGCSRLIQEMKIVN
jgi:Peptidase S46